MAVDTADPAEDGSADTDPASGRMATLLVALLSAVVLGYSLVIVQQPLLGILVVLVLAGGLVLVRFFRRFLRSYRRRTESLESIADSLERIADSRSTEQSDEDTGVES